MGTYGFATRWAVALLLTLRELIPVVASEVQRWVHAQPCYGHLEAVWGLLTRLPAHLLALGALTPPFLVYLLLTSHLVWSDFALFSGRGPGPVLPHTTFQQLLWGPLLALTPGSYRVAIS